MSSNSSNGSGDVMASSLPPSHRKGWYVIGLPLWVLTGFVLSLATVRAVIGILQALGVTFSNSQSTIVSTVSAAVIYALAIALVIGVPWLIRRSKTTFVELGFIRWPKWLDALWSVLAMPVYLIASAVVLGAAAYVLPFIDYSQPQETGFMGISSQFEYTLAFISLVIVAPIAEEVLFRGYLLGKLRKRAPLWLAIGVTSVLFGFVHFQWNVGIDVFVLSIVLCLLRVWTGSLWSPIMLHMLKNGIAYYFLFINPAVLSTLGG